MHQTVTRSEQSPSRASLPFAMPGISSAGGTATPADWLLLLLAVRDAEVPLDPVRVQKALFLLAEEGDLPDGEAYSFEPYDYGPFSSSIYRDLQGLIASGCVREVEVQGYNWKRYAVTNRGLERAQAQVDRFDGQHREVLRRLATIKNELVGLSFDALLRRVYDRYPDYAENSVFR